MESQQFVSTLDVHVGGQPLRIVTGGIPPLQGETLQERMFQFRENCDDIRAFLLSEPRGHHGMNGCVITAPDNGDSDLGAWFMNNDGYRRASGSGLIGLTAAALETGLIRGRRAEEGEHSVQVKIDTPDGTFSLFADTDSHTVRAVTLSGLPVYGGMEIETAEWNGYSVKAELFYCSGWFAMVHAEPLGISVTAKERAVLERVGQMLNHELAGTCKEKTGGRLEAVVFAEMADVGRPYPKLAAVYANGQMDRSPGGRTSCAATAWLQRRIGGACGKPHQFEGLSGSRFAVTLQSPAGTTPETKASADITAKAFVTGNHRFMLDPSDVWKTGFLLA